MSRRLRCSSVTYQSRYAPSSRPAAAGPAAHFDRNESHVIYGTGHQAQNQFLSFSSSRALARSRVSLSLADKLARPYFAILSSNRSISLLSAGLNSVVGAERVLGF